MKRWTAGILAALLVTSLGGIGVFAHGHHGRWNRGSCYTSSYCAYCGGEHGFVDADGDGVCDNFSANQSDNGTGCHSHHSEHACRWY